MAVKRRPRRTGAHASTRKHGVGIRRRRWTCSGRGDCRRQRRDELGEAHIEIADYRPGVGWLPERVAELRSNHWAPRGVRLRRRGSGHRRGRRPRPWRNHGRRFEERGNMPRRVKDSSRRSRPTRLAYVFGRMRRWTSPAGAARAPSALAMRGRGDGANRLPRPCRGVDGRHGRLVGLRPCARPARPVHASTKVPRVVER